MTKAEEALPFLRDAERQAEDARRQELRRASNSGFMGKQIGNSISQQLGVFAEEPDADVTLLAKQAAHLLGAVVGMVYAKIGRTLSARLSRTAYRTPSILRLQHRMVLVKGDAVHIPQSLVLDSRGVQAQSPGLLSPSISSGSAGFSSEMALGLLAPFFATSFGFSVRLVDYIKTILARRVKTLLAPRPFVKVIVRFYFSTLRTPFVRDGAVAARRLKGGGVVGAVDDSVCAPRTRLAVAPAPLYAISVAHTSEFGFGLHLPTVGARFLMYIIFGHAACVPSQVVSARPVRMFPHPAGSFSILARNAGVYA
jgi:hypothetical protein